MKIPFNVFQTVLYITLMCALTGWRENKQTAVSHIVSCHVHFPYKKVHLLNQNNANMVLRNDIGRSVGWLVGPHWTIQMGTNADTSLHRSSQDDDEKRVFVFGNLRGARVRHHQMKKKANYMRSGSLQFIKQIDVYCKQYAYYILRLFLFFS